MIDTGLDGVLLRSSQRNENIVFLRKEGKYWDEDDLDKVKEGGLEKKEKEKEPGERK